MPRSPYVIDNHSANATAARLVSVYGAEPIWASSPAADAVEQKYPSPRSSQPSSSVPAAQRWALTLTSNASAQSSSVVVRSTADGHAGVGEEQVDRAERAPRRRRSGRRCPPRVDTSATIPIAPFEVADHLGGIEDVGDDDAGTSGVEPPGQGGADAPSGSGDDTWLPASSMAGERNDHVNDVVGPPPGGYGVQR